MISPSNPYKLVVRLSLDRELDEDDTQEDELDFSLELFSREVLTEDDILSGRLLDDLKNRSVTIHVQTTKEMMLRGGDYRLLDELFTGIVVPGYHIVQDEMDFDNAIFSVTSEEVVRVLTKKISNGCFKTHTIHEGKNTITVHSWKCPVEMDSAEIGEDEEEGDDIFTEVLLGKEKTPVRVEVDSCSSEMTNADNPLSRENIAYKEEWEKLIHLVENYETVGA